MKTKRAIGMFLVLTMMVLLALAARAAFAPETVAEAPRAAPPLAAPAAAPLAAPASAAETQRASSAAAVVPDVSETISGAIIEQKFTLNAGWNAIYLGVEPINESPLDGDGVPTQSVMEWVFGGLGGSLDSVWTYNQPISNRDYLVDPSDGLWDEPGWDRYIPDSNLGDDGQSRGFLSTLHTLHANTGYLVKMKETGSITVKGKPVPGHHRWTPGAYNLAGFPVATGATVGVFTTGSPITEVRGLTAAGGWTTPLGTGDALAPGVAYLVRYADEPGDGDYTAPLDVGTSEEAMMLPAEGLKFKAGFGGNSTRLRLENLSGTTCNVSLSLPEGAGSAVTLYYVTNADPPDFFDLRDGTQTIEVVPGDIKWVTLQVPVEEQPVAGETLLEISCAALGTRWLIPVSAEPGSYGGLWVGNVVVNDVSEARLGSTDDTFDLTISLASQNNSGVRGAAEIHEAIVGASSTLHMTITLTLPDQTVETVTPPAVTAPYVHGWVFVDANQNGQRDADEKGLAGVTVKATRDTYFKSGATLADGSYWLDALDAGTYNLEITAPDGYASDFDVTVPAETMAEYDPDAAPVVTPNVWPTTVTIENTELKKGATAVTSGDPADPDSYLAQILPEPPEDEPYLPYYDAYDNRVEPPLNFGFVRADEVVLRPGLCDAPRVDVYELGVVKNGRLVTSYAATLASLVGDANILIQRDDMAVACGNIVASAPTAFANGQGSEARFRILLRVSQDGQTELLPYYEMSEDRRVSAVNFLSLQEPVIQTGPFGGRDDKGQLKVLEYNLVLPADDPLNPFKHKYNPDHDNLDRKYQGYEETVPLYMYESYLVNRKVVLALTEEPPGGDAAAATVDWGGATWGGTYREVIDGLHQNTITARGYFVIQRVLTADQLVEQDYDK